MKPKVKEKVPYVAAGAYDVLYINLSGDCQLQTNNRTRIKRIWIVLMQRESGRGLVLAVRSGCYLSKNKQEVIQFINTGYVHDAVRVAVVEYGT